MDNASNKGITPNELIKFLINTSFARISSSDAKKLEKLKTTVKVMLQNERKSHSGEDEKYDRLEEIVDTFFEYINTSDISMKVASGKLSKNDLTELIMTEGLQISKRKYNMSDLYREDFIAPSKEQPGRREAIFHGGIKTGIPHTYYNKDNKSITIKDIGRISYQEWGGARANLTVYQVEKEQEDGSIVSNIVCSSIAIADMDIPEYREAVLEELLSDENIINSKVQPYIGIIARMKKRGPEDIPHNEWQDATGYYYRINDSYVLEYDSTELSAVMEARKNSHLNKQNSSRSKNNSSETERRVTDSYDGHDEI